MTVFLDGLLDAIKDSLIMLPFLFGVYLLIEYMEHKAGNKIESTFKKYNRFGPIAGGIAGIIPQCGFSVAASNLYAGRVISMGTIIAVFISTSDEAIPILLANPKTFSSIWQLILIKLVISIIAGIIVDLIIRVIARNKTEEVNYHDICENCGCEKHGVIYSAFKHTLNIFIFIFIITLALNLLIGYIGEDIFSKIMLKDSFFQPFVTALVGFIPNCAASVAITQLFAEGSIISLGSCVAGLCTSAGLGLLVLFKANKHHMKQNFIIVGTLYVIAVISGIVLNLFI